MTVTIDRRRFLAVGAQGAAAAGFLLACGKNGDSGTNANGGGGGNGAVVDCTIVNNHGHNCPDVDLNATTALNLSITGGSHSHSVTLTADHLAKLNSGESVTVESGRENGHTHSVTFKT